MSKKVFKTPMQFRRTASDGSRRPPLSRQDLWREQLGLNDHHNGRTESESDSGDEPEVDQNYGKVSGLELLLLQKEVANRNKERDNLLYKMNQLRDSYHESTMKLQKAEMVRRQHLSMLKKTYEAQLDEKQVAITNLEDTVAHLEERIAEFEMNPKAKNAFITHSAPPARSESIAEERLNLRSENSRLANRCTQLETELELQKKAGNGRTHDYSTTLESLKKENERLKAEIQGYTAQLVKYGCMEEEWEAVVTENTRLQDMLTSVRQKNDVVDVGAANGDVRTYALQNENCRLNDDLSSLQGEMNDMADEYESALRRTQADNNDLRRQIDELNVKIKELESREPEVITQYQKVEVQVESEELKAALEAAEASNNELSSHITALRTTCREHEEAKQRIEEDVIELEQKLNVQTSQLRHIDAVYQTQLDELRRRSQRQLQESLQAYARLQQIAVRLNQEVVVLSRDFRLARELCRQLPTFVNDSLKYISNQIGGAMATLAQREGRLLQKIRKEIYFRNKYRDELVALKGNIRVFARVRPVIADDGGGPSAVNVVDYDRDDDGAMSVRYKNRPQTFNFDKVFSTTSSQDEIFTEAEPVITSCLDGYNVCIFAYGQTGSGKTFTMDGTSRQPGLNRRALMRLFELIDDREETWEYQVTVSYLEIYNETLRDLLVQEQDQRLEIRMLSDGALYVPGLTVNRVQNWHDVQELFRLGLANRATASTALNKHSSRSHAMLVVSVYGFDRSDDVKVKGKLNLVDLAGSERVDKSGADGVRLREAQYINKSLSTLGDVIHALKNNQSHIPFRNSKLTYLLQDSLGGDSKALMIAQCTPIERHVGETLCTLTFGQRCRQVELGPARRRVEPANAAPPTPRSSDPGARREPTNLLSLAPAPSSIPTSALGAGHARKELRRDVVSALI